MILQNINNPAVISLLAALDVNGNQTTDLPDPKNIPAEFFDSVHSQFTRGIT